MIWRNLYVNATSHTKTDISNSVQLVVSGVMSQQNKEFSLEE